MTIAAPAATAPAPGGRPDPALASQLRIAVLRLARRMRNQGRVEGNDLTPTQLAVLATLDRHGPMRLGELASHERVQPPSMTKTVEALVARGLVAREQQAADRRQVVVTLCGEGQALLAADRQSRDKWLARRLAELTPAEHDLLERAAALLDRLGTE